MQKSKYYGSALQAASHGGHIKIARLLLDKDADVNAHQGGYYGNALQAASHGSCVTTVYTPLSFSAIPKLPRTLFTSLYPCCYDLTNFVEPSFVITCFSYSHVNIFTCLQFHMLSVITCYLISHVYYYLLCMMYL